MSRNCSFDNATTKDHGQNRGQDHFQDLGQDHGDMDTTMEDIMESQSGSEGRKEPYSVLQMIQVTAKSWLDAASGQTWLVITHSDVTKAEVTFNRLERITEAQLSILAQSFPKHVIDYMCGSSEEQEMAYGSLARSHEGVTILFMDIVGFTTMSKNVASADVLNFLNQLFTLYDGLCDEHKVHKVETAGDCYIVSCGIMERDDNDGFVKVTTEHDPSKSAEKLLGFAKDMLRISKLVNMPHDNKPVTIRIGMHTGAVVSGVIGTKLPKYSVFGDTMNTASRMESTANHGGIQVSADTFCLLQSAGNTDAWEGTGGIEVKGKGIMETFHIQIDEAQFDVNAIKVDYKDALEKADNTIEGFHSEAGLFWLMRRVQSTDDKSIREKDASIRGKDASVCRKVASVRRKDASINRKDASIHRKEYPGRSMREDSLAKLLFIGIPSDEKDFPSPTRKLVQLPCSTRGQAAIVGFPTSMLFPRTTASAAQLVFVGLNSDEKDFPAGMLIPIVELN
eukprot:gene17662-24010_t